MKNAQATNTNETEAVVGRTIAPEKATSKKAASRKKEISDANRDVSKTAKQAKGTPTKQIEEKVTIRKSVKVTETAGKFSKKSIVLDLPRRPQGAPMVEIAPSLTGRTTTSAISSAEISSRRWA